MNYKANSRNQFTLIYNIKFWIITVILIVFYSALLVGQNIVYIDPTNSGDPDEDGTIEHPWDSWSDISKESNTVYLQKRGTTASHGTIEFLQKNNVTLGAYGTGDRPKLVQQGGGHFIKFTSTSNATVKDLEIIGDVENSTGLVFAGGYYVGGIPANNIKVINCEIHGGFNGVRIVPGGSSADTLTVRNTTIYDIWDDGIYTVKCDSVTIEGCHIYKCNMGWHLHPQGHDEANAAGDLIHLTSICKSFRIVDNILDRRYTGNKFCFIHNCQNEWETNTGEISGNTFYMPKDTVGQVGGGSCFYLKRGAYVNIERNKFIGGENPYGNSSASLGYMNFDEIDFRYNVLDSVNRGGTAMNNEIFRFFNNTSVHEMTSHTMLWFNGTDSAFVKNNIFAYGQGHSPYGGYPGYIEVTDNIEVEGNSGNWGTNPGFIDWQNGNYSLVQTSPAIDIGLSYSGWNTDYLGNFTPQGDARDLGACEFPEGGQTNLPPEIEDQSFSVEENAANNFVIGTVEAEDPDAGQTIVFYITDGNTSNAFQIGPLTGELYVANSAAIDFETTPQFNLTVKVQDDGPGNLSATATVTVNLEDINEVPEIEDQTFSIQANINVGEVVGIVEATDPDQGQSLTYSITGGNTDNAFAIDDSNGEITVIDNSAINSTTPDYILNVMVQDDGEGELSAEANVTITIEEVNQAPNVDDQDFDVDENSDTGTEVGTVIATDPDAGQTLTYSIISGNTDNAFDIDDQTGTITVANSDALDFETINVFSLTVEVEDDASNPLTDQATITVNLNDINEVPNVDDQNFVVEEGIGNGELVGTVEATDPDQGQTLTFSIIGGNSDGAFAIDALSGDITVADNSVLNFTVTPVYFLDVQVQDDGQGELTDQAVMAISADEINQAPNIDDQDFTIDENLPNGEEVGTVVATDPDAGQALTFSILSGNTGSAFLIAEETGVLTINNTYAINFEENQSFELIVEVQDDGIGNLTDQASVFVNLNDLNENPEIENQTFSTDENSPAGMEVGTVEASDPDFGQNITFSILSGNPQDAFAIDNSTGVLTISNEDAIDYESHATFYLIIEVVDDGNGNLSNQAVVTINLNDVNETPVIEDQYFMLEEFSPEGTAVGDVEASDPDNGQELTYSILSGNFDDAFSIDPQSGTIYVENSEVLDIQINPVFILLVEVTDNGQGNLSDQGVVVIALTTATDVEENSSSETADCNLYPNPVNGFLNLSFTNIESSSVIVKIVDLQGRLVAEKEYSNVMDHFSEKINTSGWEEGLYIVHINAGDIILQKKIMKAN